MKYLLLLFPLTAFAGPYIEGGFAAPEKPWYEDNHTTHGFKHDGLQGTVEVGYTYNHATIYIEHLSDISGHDHGLNVLGAKYRLEWK
jgi:hypothetical protein